MSIKNLHKKLSAFKYNAYDFILSIGTDYEPN